MFAKQRPREQGGLGGARYSGDCSGDTRRQ